VLWGWNFDSVLSAELAPGAPFRAAFDQAALRRSIADYRGSHLEPLLLRLRRALGCICYTITPRGARRLIEFCFPLRPLEVGFPLLDRRLPNTGVDIPMNAAYDAIEAYVCFPPLVVTPNDTANSTVQGR
jgi:hypothetical protein